MTATYLLLTAFAIGHVTHTILLLNVAHGHGMNLPWMDRAVFAGVALFGLTGVVAGWSLSNTAWTEWPTVVRAYSVVCIGTVIVALPTITFARSLRCRPPGANRLRSRIIDLASRHGLGSLIGPSGRAWLLRIPGNDAFRLQLNEWELTIDSLPESLDGLTILHLTDLHFAPTYSRRFFDEVIEAAIGDGAEPDLVMITGDFLDHDGAIDWVVPVLSRLRGRLGQFAILGNHDYRHDFRNLRRALRSAGFRTLEGRWTVLEIGENRVALGGTSYPWGKDLGLRDLPATEIRIVLSHSPDEVYKASKWGVDLMLCGHNHGGQVRLPGFGPVLTPSRFSRRFDRGFFRVGETLMFVSQGIGAKDPIRIGCIPEVTRLVLKSRATSLGLIDASRDDSLSNAGIS
ncbi:MAG: cpdA 5 [Planctomycetota bacterium]|nr:cpdA 5 [Planctomycetota bacterium]